MFRSQRMNLPPGLRVEVLVVSGAALGEPELTEGTGIDPRVKVPGVRSQLKGFSECQFPVRRCHYEYIEEIPVWIHFELRRKFVFLIGFIRKFDCIIPESKGADHDVIGIDRCSILSGY